MKKLFTLLVFTSMFACSEEEKTEYRTIETKISSLEGVYCFCSEITYNKNDEIELGYTRLADTIEQYVREGRKCEDLGFIQQSDGSFEGPNNNTECGANSYFVTGS